MSAIICPTITPDSNPFSYDIQLKRLLPFAKRIHIDFMDGEFAAPKSLSIYEMRLPEGITVDLHVMYRQPGRMLRVATEMHPSLIVMHAESEGRFMVMAEYLHANGVRVGVSLLPGTPVDTIAPAIDAIDHVLIFSGKLGHYGGIADLRLLAKAKQLRALKPELEIAWDGGVNASNVRQLAAGGIDVLNVGGYIQHAINPAQAYATLESLT